MKMTSSSSSSPFLIIFSLLLSLTFINLYSTQELLQLNDDVLGLVVFKSALKDPLNSLTSWSEDDNSPCSWNFIKCNPKNNRVSEISLDGLNLSGKIGRGLEKLEFLEVLSLSNNNLSGTINHELGFIKNLKSLNLCKNNLLGEIPLSLSNLSSLRFLDLSQNHLTGPLLDTLFQNLLSLRHLSLARNDLQGQIPNSVFKCATLNHLNLSDNHFSGNPFFSTLTRLRTLDLSNNGLSGSVPNGMAFVHNLKEFNLNKNQFSGSLPYDIGFCPHLIKLDFSNNYFTGIVPQSFQRLNQLKFLSLSNNFVNGDFPQWIGQMSSLEYLDFSNNGLMGNVATSIKDLKMLKYLSLCNNKLNGSVPYGLFDMKLDVINLSKNEFTGYIPSLTSNLFENLQVLDLSRNNLIGEIPTEMGLLARLKYLNLSWNHLESKLPPEFGYFQNLTVLDLRNNILVGSIPGDICDSNSLEIMQLDGNSLTGKIPEEIGKCSSLSLLSLSSNNLTGLIPKSLSLLSKLKILKLEYNQLTGDIPQDLGKLENLLIANVSYNRLVGRLPIGGIFPTLDESALEGNLGICSPLLKGPCIMDIPKPIVINPGPFGKQNREHGSSNHRFLSVSSIIAISAAALIAFGVMVISLINASVRRRISFVDNALESMCSSSTKSANLAAGKLILFDSKSCPNWLSTNFESILNKATEIGEGAFGTVYKATLGGEEGTTLLAVKKLVTSNTLQYHEEFDREVRILGQAKHPNLIPLKGYYWTADVQLLISDFAVRGSLQEKLHEPSPSSPPLSWPSRFKIVLGIAKGLSHLHHSFRPPIIHYNLKPSNVLLDENLNPKISDFGLSRLVTKVDKYVLSNRFQSAYIAPELACRSLRVNEKCDVYGFGVLILELVTGRKAVEYGEDNVVILSDHVRILLEHGDVLDCVDSSMGDYPEEEVLPVVKLALVCTSQIPSSRPSMAEVVQILEVIKTPIPHRMEAY